MLALLLCLLYGRRMGRRRWDHGYCLKSRGGTCRRGIGSSKISYVTVSLTVYLKGQLLVIPLTPLFPLNYISPTLEHRSFQFDFYFISICDHHGRPSKNIWLKMTTTSLFSVALKMTKNARSVKFRHFLEKRLIESASLDSTTKRYKRYSHKNI